MFASFLLGSSLDVAPRLLGCYLVRELDGERLVGKIVETEAYDQMDAASHAFHGNTGRAAVTFGPAGYLYVHASRHHFLCDITTGTEGHSASVLLRALEPIKGQERMRLLRGAADDQNLTNGPAKLCQALAIDAALYGHDLRNPPLQLVIKPPVYPGSIVQTTRIGITKDAHRPWRFYVRGSRFVSNPK